MQLMIIKLQTLDFYRLQMQQFYAPKLNLMRRNLRTKFNLGHVLNYKRWLNAPLHLRNRRQLNNLPISAQG
jgi:hypothetical protein